MLASSGGARNKLCGLSATNCDTGKVTEPKGYLSKAIDTKDIFDTHLKDQQKEIAEKGPSNQQALKDVVDATYKKNIKKRNKLDQLGGAMTKQRSTHKKRVVKKTKPAKRRSVSKKSSGRAVGSVKKVKRSNKKRVPKRLQKGRF